MIRVKARPNESAEQLVRRFKKICEKEGINKEIKRRAFYEKPSETTRHRRKRPLRPATPVGPYANTMENKTNGRKGDKKKPSSRRR